MRGMVRLQPAAVDARLMLEGSVRRQSACQYTVAADILHVTGPSRPRRKVMRPGGQGVTTAPGVHRDPRLAPRALATHPNLRAEPSLPVDEQISPRPPVPSPSHPPALYGRFDINTCHPFRNYWTNTGGLTEVVGILPPREEADRLVWSYFTTVDPIYPIIPRQSFTRDYEEFWQLSAPERANCEPALVALQLAIYATAAQYSTALPANERAEIAEFYLSACHQALCLSSYLNHCSLTTIQTMILVCHFLITDNRIPEAWTFSGLGLRQVYGLQLNRDPELLDSDAPFSEKQQRCRLWWAAMFQDTSLSMFLGMPPATAYHDIELSNLKHPDDAAQRAKMDIPGFSSDASVAADIPYLRAMWQYASFTQANICIPRSLKRPVCSSPEHKTQLVSQFRTLYTTFEPPFNSFDPARFEHTDERLVRQLISTTTNFFYTLTVLYMDEDADAGTEVDVYGALDAAHEGMLAFFKLARVSPEQTDIWGAAHTRAYSQAVSPTLHAI